MPPYETPEAEDTAFRFVEELKRKASGTERNPTERGVHVDVEHGVKGIMILFALTRNGVRIAERQWNVMTGKGEELATLRDELTRLLDAADPEESSS